MTTVLHYYGHHPFPVHQDTGDIRETLPGQCHLGDKVLDGNARLAYCRRDVLHLAVPDKKCPHLVFRNVDGRSLLSCIPYFVPIYFVCRRTDFAAKMMPANCLATCSVASKMFHSAFDFLARILKPAVTIFNASFIVSLLIPVNYRLFTSVVTRKIVLALTAFSASGIVRNSFPLVYST